jgi:hypothetical protein
MDNYEISDFIGIFPNAVSPQTCEKIIEHFEYIKNLGHSTSRKSSEGTRFLDKDNETYFLKADGNSVVSDLDHYFTQEFVNTFWNCFESYQKKYGVVEAVGKLGFTGKFKIQKNQPGEGYHVWHCEDDSPHTMRRIMTFILYLNDVVEGGETEFIYYPKRVKAQTGRIVLWPAGYTHAHRGNPPLSNTKYIVTGWVEFN